MNKKKTNRKKYIKEIKREIEMRQEVREKAKGKGGSEGGRGGRTSNRSSIRGSQTNGGEAATNYKDVLQGEPRLRHGITAQAGGRGWNALFQITNPRLEKKEWESEKGTLKERQLKRKNMNLKKNRKRTGRKE